ncbi:solute carrier organic anion transporter family member 6A1 [Rousettus aegyptiacus]|uniref:solute carrier organic anion transporter family member 6A1 n=1 Tax=Rousettus aegyptiacus TaxID=9407 RepID=UPI00168D6BE3|nr:solute carrier organic anion transporter family member 6A1 [Rousettus aegyptiacus]
MQAALRGVEPQASQAQRRESAVPGEAKKARKKLQYMRMSPANLVTLRSLLKKKRNKSAIAKRSGEQSKNSNEVSGLDCVVIPNCQRFNNINCFLIFFCILTIAQATVDDSATQCSWVLATAGAAEAAGIAFGLVDLSIDTFRRDSSLNVIASMLLSLVYDISSCLIAVFIAYYGGRGNKLKWITVSSILIGFGSLLFAFPYLGNENYRSYGETEEDICKAMKIIKTCRRTTSFPLKYVSFFILGQIVLGVAGMLLFILGVNFLIESVDTYAAGIYLGFADASGIIGYALGYAIGAPLIKTFEDIIFDASAEDSADSHAWLRTWWIRFVFVSIISWSTSIPLSCFSHPLQGTTRIKPEEHKMPYFVDKKQKDQELGTSIKDLFASILILIKTPIFVSLALARASESLLIIGASAFLPIYVENQFMVTPTKAATLSGLVLIPGAALGQLLGGIIVSKLQIYCKGLLTFIMVTSMITVVLVIFMIFVYCNPMPFAGINEDYGGTGQSGNLTAPCNSHCGCSPSFYSTVCGRDDVEYFSPCFAGCTHSKKLENNQKTYFNCSCINEGLITPDDQGDFIDARSGICNAKCSKLPLFLVLTFCAIVFADFADVPNLLTILRVVSDKQRCLALGVTYVILRLFGSIPGPIAFKIIGETSCTFRDTGHCGIKGSCWIYDTTKMAYLFVGICSFCKVFTIIFTAIGFGLYTYLLKENSDILPVPAKNLKIEKKKNMNL